jgi:hypothetical protein
MIWFQLGMLWDATKPGFGRAFSLEAAAPESSAALVGQLGHQVR